MKPWLAKTLLGSAIALVLLAGLWMVLDARWSGMVERLRAQPRGSAEELLPPIDPAQDAGPIYGEACQRWIEWYEPEKVPLVNRALWMWRGGRIFRLEEWTIEDESALAWLDDPDVTGVRVLLQTAGQKQNCRLWNPRYRGVEPVLQFWLLELGRSVLMPDALRAARRADTARAWDALGSALALAVHAREDPSSETLFLSRTWAQPALRAVPSLLVHIPIDATRARRLLALLDRIQPDRDALRALDGDRVLCAEPIWDDLVAGRFPTGVSLPSDLADSLRYRILRTWRLLDECRYFEIQDELRERLASDPWRAPPQPEVSDMYPFTRELLPDHIWRFCGPWMLEERRARDLAEIALRLAIARAEHGAYPDSLAELGDTPREPLTGVAYTYAREADGCTLGDWRLAR